MKRILNTLLFLTFILTLLVPITGVHIHKLASVIFLILCLVHTGVYWKKMNIFRFFVLGLIFEVFLTGLFGMIFKQYPIILSIHTISSIAVVFFLAIHIFVFKKNSPSLQQPGACFCPGRARSRTCFPYILPFQRRKRHSRFLRLSFGAAARRNSRKRSGFYISVLFPRA